MGIVPQALVNFLTLLGWSPGGDRELFTTSEAAGWFDLSDVNKAPAIFDQEKLLWMNGQYVARMSADEIYPHLVPFLGDRVRPLDELRAVIEMTKVRGRTLAEVADAMQPFLIEDEAIAYDAEASKKHLKGEDMALRLAELRDALGAVEPFDVATTEQALRTLAESRGLGAGKLIHPLRLALTGRGASPPIFDVVVALGREKTIARLNRLIATFGG